MILIKKVLDKYKIPRRFDTREEIENILENVLSEKFIRGITVEKTRLTNENKRLLKENKSSKTRPETINDNKQIRKDNSLKREALEYETNQIEKIKVKLYAISKFIEKGRFGIITT